MGCEKLSLPGGGVAIVCTRGRGRARKCCACTLAGGFQCDWKMGGAKTCDRYICPDHAKEVAKDKHLCPEHQEAYKAWLAARKPVQEHGSDEAHQGDVDQAHALGLDWKGA